MKYSFTRSSTHTSPTSKILEIKKKTFTACVDILLQLLTSSEENAYSCKYCPPLSSHATYFTLVYYFQTFFSRSCVIDYCSCFMNTVNAIDDQMEMIFFFNQKIN